MENTALTQQLREHLRVLPPDIRGFITDGHYEQQLKEALAPFSLSPAQRAQIDNEVVLVLMTFQPLSQLQKNIEENTDIDNHISGEIVKKLYVMLLDLAPTLAAIEQAKQQREVRGAAFAATTDMPQPATSRVVWNMPQPHTKQGDVHPPDEQKGDTAGEAPPHTPVPRYAKPLTDTPRYHADDARAQ